LTDLSSRSTIVTEATLVDIEDGAIFGSSPDDEAASYSVNLIFETEAGDRYYVERPRPAYMGIDELRAVMPLGAASVIYLQPNNDPRGQNYFNLREGPTWFFSTPQGWILDDPERGIGTPLESLDMLGFEPPADGDTDLRAWLVDSPSSSTVSVPDADREALIASGDPSVVLDCPDGRLPLPSPAYEYAENTPVFDTAVEAVEWWLSNASRDALRVGHEDVTVLNDVVIPVEIHDLGSNDRMAHRELALTDPSVYALKTYLLIHPRSRLLKPKRAAPPVDERLADAAAEHARNVWLLRHARFTAAMVGRRGAREGQVEFSDLIII